ncbi:MAG: Molybdopterin synthase catalytic subunit [Pleopsidium flavum]|nr:MAG: Molybdopterin synthase catalytic subunit [Pleopsidium flavum]
MEDSDATQSREEENIYVALSRGHLDILSIMNKVKSPKAGAVVLFAGTTRDNFNGKPVKELQYTSYIPKALNTLLTIAKDIRSKHGLTAVSMIHRLGRVPIGEESILIAVSSPHRQAAWKAGEEALEECKAKAEVWKLEEFGGDEGGVWRANRDGAVGTKIPQPDDEIEDSDEDRRTRGLPTIHGGECVHGEE